MFLVSKLQPYLKGKKKHTQETRNGSSTQSRLRPWTPAFTCLFGGKGCVKLKAPRSVFVGGCSQFSFLECKSCMQYISSKHFQTHVCRLGCSGFFFFFFFFYWHPLVSIYSSMAWKSFGRQVSVCLLH